MIKRTLFITYDDALRKDQIQPQASLDMKDIKSLKMTVKFLTLKEMWLL